MAIGREMRRERMALEIIARGNQKLEPSFLERTMRRKNVVCMRIYPASMRRMSRESAFLARSQKRRTIVPAAYATHVGDFI
jgi:predicted HTH transcriptional regulator